MSIELSKSQKKIARELIDKSLQKECAQFLEKIEISITEYWKGKNPHESYLNLYRKVESFDKHIARRYDGLRGSNYYIALVGLFVDKILTQEDLNRFDEDLKQRLLNTAKLWDDSE